MLRWISKLTEKKRMLCSILHRYLRINPEHQTSGLNQKTPKCICLLSPFLPLADTFLELFEGADEIVFDLLLVTTFRNVEVGNAVLEDRLQLFFSFFRIRRRSLRQIFASFGILAGLACWRNSAFGRHIGVDTGKFPLPMKSREVPHIVIVYRIIWSYRRQQRPHVMIVYFDRVIENNVDYT